MAEKIPGYGGAWQDDHGSLADSAIRPLNETINVLVTKDVAGAERRLRTVWPGSLCVGLTTHTMAELLRINNQLSKLPGYLNGGPELGTRNGKGTGAFVVTISSVYDDGTLQKQLDEKYGPGLVEVTSRLQPYVRRGVAIEHLFEYNGVLKTVAEDVTPVRRALEAFGDGLVDVLAAVDAGGLDHEDDAGLLVVLRDFERVRNRLALVDHRLVQAIETRGLPETVCAGSTRALLASTMRISKAEAGRRVRAAEAVGPRSSMLGEPLEPVRPHLAEAQQRGEVTPEQVGIIERALAGVDRRGFDPGDLALGEELLTAHATSFGPEDLRELAERVVDAIDPDGTLPRDEVNADRRMLIMRPTGDGAYAGDFRLTGVLGAKFRALLDPLARPRLTTAALVGPGEGDPSVASRLQAEADPRTHPQRMHDALEELCDRLLAVGDQPGAGGVPASVVVTIGLDDLLDQLGYGRTSDGTLLSAAEALRLAEQADIIPAVLDQAGAVLDLGRTQRLASRSQTLALYARDGGCSFPGCDRAPQWTERHHIVAWTDGGPTDLDNLTLLCGYHHHHFAGRGWTCRLNADRIPEWVPPRWIDPEQKPLLNSRISTRLAARRETGRQARRQRQVSALERLWNLSPPPGHTYDPPLLVDEHDLVDHAWLAADLATC